MSKRLKARRAHMTLMDAYYSGDHPLPFVTAAHADKMRSQFRRLLEDSRSNFMQMVVDAVEERLKVEGFRLSAKTDAVADARSWEIWQENQMDANSQTAFVEALVKGVSYLSVWKDNDDAYPTIAVEDPLQTIVAYEPGSNYAGRAAALKIWKDDLANLQRANVYLPDGIYKFSAPSTRSQTAEPKWQPLNDDASWDGDGFVANPLGVVPIIPLRNRPRLLKEGESELYGLFRIQNSINSLLFLLALAGYFGAHRQRWAVGIKLFKEDGSPEPDPFDAAVDKLWAVENPADGPDGVKFGEFEQTTLDGYIAAIEQKVRHIAIQSRVPRHYLEQTGQSPSGDAIESAEAGLVKKVERIQRPFGEGLEEAMRLARRFDGAGESPPDSEIVWADAQTESEATITDAVIKQFQAGLIPWEASLEKLGYTQTQIARFSGMRAQDALLREILNPTPPAQTPAPPAPPPVA